MFIIYRIVEVPVGHVDTMPQAIKRTAELGLKSGEWKIEEV